MKKVIKYFAVVLSVIMVFTLMGCGDQQTGEQGSTSNAENTENTEKGPEIITFGYIDAYSHRDLDPNINERIVSFNRSQNDYFIEIVKYGEDNYADGLAALNTDITAGKAPDIIAIDDKELLTQLGKKDAIEDLYFYMDESEGLKREDFVENVLHCMENDGKLYGMVPLFTISSLVANPNHISTETFTFEQLKEMYEENQGNEEILVYNGLAKYPLLSVCIIPSLGEFVDMENKTCDFTKEEFRTLLEFSMQFEDLGDGGYWGDDFQNYSKLMEDKLYVFYGGRGIGSFREYTKYHGLMGESGKLVGFPSISGCEPQITTNFSYLAINGESQHKDVAWQFICTFLENRYLTSSNIGRSDIGFPVTQTAFNMLEQLNVENENSWEQGITNSQGETLFYPIDPVTEEDVEYIREIIAEAQPEEDYGDIIGIVAEEIVSYWNGSKTVEEVVDVIQNRAQLYLDEMK